MVVNLASNEYFKSVKKADLNGDILNVEFKENRNGVLKVISFTAKKARGRMAHLIVKEGIMDKEKLKNWMWMGMFLVKVIRVSGGIVL